ncbi:S8 family serine peptidase [Sutcliffiella horikoshii]|uniref:S8 family serine peptidase n=1 Tax=Sutcliffiella horikoshii TaxID=79883 RepID=A0A5D4SY89_9BACI|nr:cell wall-binding repeat-containing protein [Sutcliffiella horikoshii]TYS67182.1 S8 family serine peptidase [Sutcliffiella horikoshii]
MSKRKRQTRRVLSILLLIAMLINIALPNLTLANTASDNQNQTSDETFNAEEVNRILAGLTSEQKANINKLTGAENAKKIHVDPSDLRSSKNLNVIVQFTVDPAKIQMIKQALANGGATVNNQEFATDYAEAEKRVEESHKQFKSFVNSQPKTQIIGGQTINNSMSITREFSEAFNGVALSLPANLVTSIAEFENVASIWTSETFEVPQLTNTADAAQTSGMAGKPTSGLKLLGLDKLQAEGHTGIIKSGPNAGEKVKVGVLDTGIDYNHPDLYKVTHDENGKRYGGHDFINAVVNSDGTVVFSDDNDPMETIYSDWLHAKENPSSVLYPATPDYKNYITAHGTHVSGTVAANTTDNNLIYSANGVAPDVELHGYRVLGPGGIGFADAILNGIDQAVKDGMQVINLSLGSLNNDPLYPTSIAINNATLAGVTCVVSAGNAGPSPATVGSPGTAALAITIGASTIPVEIPVMTIINGKTPYQARLFGKSFTDSDDAFAGKTFSIVDVGLGKPTNYNGKDLSGKIALVKRGGFTLTEKMGNAKAAGAIGMIIWNNAADEDNQGYISAFLGTSMDNVYSVSLTQSQGQALVDVIANDPSKETTITFPSKLDTPIMKNADELAGFSSTGPVNNYDIKPDVIAPGVDIISTMPFDTWEPQEGQPHDYTYAYQSMSGTSMAAPHVTGVAALVLAANPDYKPADIKTALTNTAKDVNTESTTYSVYQVGAGRVDPGRAINADVKIQVLDKANHYDDPRYIYENDPIMRQIDDIRGSIFFGFKGRGEGANDGSDDVVSSKDFNVINQGTSSKTFNVSTTFISTKFAESNEVGPGTGNDVKVDVSVNNDNRTSIQVDGASTVKATATITIPSNAMEGTYEGYIYLVNASDSTESYRIPFTISIAEKGIDFAADIKSTTVSFRDSGYFNPNAGAPGLGYRYTVNSQMESMYLLLKDNEGNYLGIVQNESGISHKNPGVIYTRNPMLISGRYLPFTKPYNGSLDQSGLATEPVVAKHGAYSVEMVAIDKAGNQYRDEDTVYVDYLVPTLTMDPDSKPGIYEIDPTGYQPGQEIKRFYGTVYDSNIDVMKNNGDTSVPDLNDSTKLVPANQSLNTVWAYQDDVRPTHSFTPDANGRFHFGLAPEDITRHGSLVRMYAADYSGAGDIYSQQRFYFIKKGSPYVTLTSSGGVDSELESQGKVVVEPSKEFKATIATKNGIGMTGGKFTLNNAKAYEFSNVRISDEYKQYLDSKGITATLTVSDPYKDRFSSYSIDITISGIDAAGALDQDMNIIEADVTYTNPEALTGPWEYEVLESSFILSGKDTMVPAFMANWPYVKQPISNLSGGIFAEGFKVNTLSGSYMNVTVESGAKVTVTDANGKSYITDNPTTDMNTVEWLGNTAGTYAVTMDASDKPYNVEIFMPGHFKGYKTTPVIGDNRHGYQTGAYYDMPSHITPLLPAGDVNGDDVIDMNDLLEEVKGYETYKELTTTADKKAFLTNPENRKYDIRWVDPSGWFGYGIDYYDFYYIFKNFGQQNQSALKTGVPVPTPQLTLTADTIVNGVQLKAGDGVDEVRTALNFAGPPQKTTSTIPKLEELQNGSKITLIPTDRVFLDDVTWRNAITEIHLNDKNVINELITGTSNKAVTISAAHYYFSVMEGHVFVPSEITLDGSLFKDAGNYTVIIKAAGYQDVSLQLTVAEEPIPTPEIPLVIDPTKAHLGKDLTYTFTDDANWRNGINKIVVQTRDFKDGVDITNMTDGNGNKYYDISQPGQITFKKELFKTNASPVLNTSPIVPGGENDLPQLYKFEIRSTGTDGTIYPVVTAGTYTGDNGLSAAQAIGFRLTFDTQGGHALDPIAVGYRPGRSKYGTKSSDWSISQTSPVPTRPGYIFRGWFNEPECTTSFNQHGTLTADKTVYAKWEMEYVQNYSPVDKNNPDGKKFSQGWVLGEGDLEITIPDYQTNVSWLKDKSSIASIEATYYKVKSDGTSDSVTTTYTLDPSTYNLVANADGSGTLSFTTATESYADAHPIEKFAFSEAPYPKYPYIGYKLTMTSIGGESLEIPNVKLGYRTHFDLNGGTLIDPENTFFEDRFAQAGRATSPNMLIALNYVKNGELSVSPTLYLDSEGTSGKASEIASNIAVLIKENTTFYLNWIKTPPTVSKDTLANTVGSDITLSFTDDGIWKNNIKQVLIGSKELVLDTDYTIKDNEITLDRSLFTFGQKVNVVIISEGYLDVVVTDQVIGYLVTFESNGGDGVPSQIVDSRVSKPADPALIGYKFAGWYTDQVLTKPYDFTSVVTQPITLYAKYALATSLVSPDSKDNALGNDMTLEFSDVDWAKVITGIKINGSSVDESKYKVDTAAQTITLDKSLFTKTGEFTINIRATDYADVLISQKVVKGINVQFVLPSDAPEEVKEGVKDQIVVRRITEPTVYGYELTWFADEARTIPWEFTNSIYSSKTLYGKWALQTFNVEFDTQGGGTVESKTAAYNTTIKAPVAPKRLGYIFDGWYKDAECTLAWDFAGDKVAEDITLYAKWTKMISDVQPSSDMYVQPGDKIEVSFRSEAEGGDASFSIKLPLQFSTQSASSKKMEEIEPGVYKGTWEVPANINLQGAMIEVEMTDAAGNKAVEEASGKLFINTENMDRIFGETRYHTAVEISKKGWSSSNVVVLARSDNYADALAGTPLAHKHKAPILLTKSNELSNEVLEELHRLKATEVIVLGGTSAISDKVVSTLKNKKLKVTRIAGKDRYETASKIAKQVAPEGTDKAVVVYGGNFPDAISVASHAAREGLPILLTKTNDLPTATQAALDELGVSTSIAVGGKAVISEAVHDQLPNAERISGQNRYETNIELAKVFTSEAKHIYVATGNNFADALTGSVLAAKNNSSIILVGINVPASTLSYLENNRMEQITIFGGNAAVNHDVVKELQKFID